MSNRLDVFDQSDKSLYQTMYNLENYEISACQVALSLIRWGQYQRALN